MYNTSNAYKQQNKRPLRNPTHIQVSFGLVDPEASGGAQITDNGRMPWSNLPDLVDALPVPTHYGTLEPGLWLLDGSVATLGGTVRNQGWVSSRLSEDASGCPYPESLTMQMTFASPTMLRGLGIDFDTTENIYPKTVLVQADYLGSQVYSNMMQVASAQLRWGNPIPETDGYIDSLTLTFYADELPHRRLRIEDIILGIRRTMTSDDIVSAKWERSTDLMNTVLPSDTFTFTFYDTAREYNPDNPEGIWEYLESGQQIAFSLGYELDDGSVEWIPCGKNYADGRPSIAKADTLSEVTFKAISRVETLTEIYDEGVYSYSGTTLYELAERVLRWSGCVTTSGENDFTLSDSLRNYVLYAPLPQLEARELLQLIANAGMCLLRVDREGKPEIVDRASQVSDFTYTLNDVLEQAPAVDKYPILRNLSTSLTTYSLGDATQLAEIEVNCSTPTQYVVDYSSATNLAVTSPDGLSIVSVDGLYAQRAKVTVQGTGTLVINGTALVENVTVITKNFSPTGEDCVLETNLLGTREQALQYLDWMGEVLQKRNVYTFRDRGFPELDVGDIVGIDTSFTEAKHVNITSSAIDFAGGISCETEVLG